MLRWVSLIGVALCGDDAAVKSKALGRFTVVSSLLMSAFILVVTILVLRSSRYWVYYETDRSTNK